MIALITVSPLAFVRFFDGGTRLDLPGNIQVHGADVGWEGAGYRLVPVEDTNPPVNPATEIKTGPVVTAFADKVTRVWTVRSKTAQELDDEKTAAAAGINDVLFKVAFNHENRIRTLAGQASVTAAQFRAAIKALL